MTNAPGWRLEKRSMRGVARGAFTIIRSGCVNRDRAGAVGGASLGPATMYGCLLAAAGVAATVSDAFAQQKAIEPRDMIELATIAEARLAPNGRYAAYAVRVRDLDSNRATQSFWRVSSSGGQSDSLPINPDASHLRWRPDGTAVSYLAPDTSGTAQVWEYVAGGAGQEPRQLTFHATPVLAYEWSGDGLRLAFTASIELTTPSADDMGVVIDRLHFFHHRLLSNEPLNQRDAHYGDPPVRIELWVQDVETVEPRLLSGDLSVSAFAWSPDGRMIALTARHNLRRLPSHLASHDLLLSTLDGRIDVLETGAGGDYLDDTVIYEQPFWSPDGSRVGYFRRDWRERWEGSPQLGVFSLAERRTVLLISDEELETYRARAFWLQPDTVFLENTSRAGRRLFAVAMPSGSVSPVVESDEWFDQHSFSEDGRLVAFVRERIDTPPELYVSDRAMREPHRLTDLHGPLGAGSQPRVERLRWAGEDGVGVEGWLYIPSGEPPFATIVFVHGGPTWVYGNRYEPYLPIWPHAFGVYAARGIAVFVPNYRGTGSFGKAFRRRSSLDAEPASDIITGLDTLVARGFADENRLGIAGHSHGCWLGPLVAVRNRRFAAVACAEGSGDWASFYARNAGWMNSEIVEYYWGGGSSPYEDPERYRRLSPVYHFQGLRTPFLFEAGELGVSLSALEYAAAAWREGVPHELVIYRETDHTIVTPRTMLEAMQRNLDWFEFWLLGQKDPVESKLGQYERWTRLKEEVRRVPGSRRPAPGERSGGGTAEIRGPTYR